MGKAQTRAKRKYNEANYFRVALTIPIGQAEPLKKYAEQKGLSVNKLLNDYISSLLNDTNTSSSPDTNTSTVEVDYGKLLYKILKPYANKSKVVEQKFEIRELKDLLGITGKLEGRKALGRWREFEPRVLRVAKEDINKKSSLEIDYVGIKSLRVTKDVIFTIRYKTKPNALDKKSYD